MFNKLLFCIVLLGLAKGGDAQSGSIFSKNQTTVFSLPEILDSIDARNPGLKQFYYKTRASEQKAEAALAWPAPTAGLGLDEFPYSSTSLMEDNQGVSRKMVMLRLQQMFPNFGRQRKQQAYQQSYAEQYRDERETFKNKLFAKAKLAYYDAYTAAKKIKVISEQQKQLLLLIKIAEGRLPYGKARVTDVYKARAKMSDLGSKKIALRSIQDQAKAVLNSLMNFPVDASLRLDTAITEKGSYTDILLVDSSYIKKHRSDIQHIDDEIHAVRLKQQVLSAEKTPTLGLTFDNMRMPVKNGAISSSMYMYNVMAMVSIPIAPWFSKGYKAGIRSMDSQIMAMNKAQAAQIQEAAGNIRKDWLRLQSAKKELDRFQSQVIVAYNKVFQASLNAFSENMGDIYETLSAWEELTEKKLLYYDKLETLLNIRVLLEAEMQEY